MYSVYDITNCDYGFPYSQLMNWFTKDDVFYYCNSFRQQCSKITKEWDKAKNAEWLIRHYLSIKMILAASVMLSSADYSKKKNIRITEPYLYYYAILSCCRALTFTLPFIDWKAGKLIDMTHKKILSISIDTVKTISKKHEADIKHFFDYTKSMRELFSYKFPASGLNNLNESNDYGIDSIIEICSMICEVAQLHSELIQASISKNTNENVELEEADIKCCFEYDVNGVTYIDQDDWYRINYMTRKMKKPLNLYWMMTEGLVEDFFGAWIPEDNNDNDLYNPDEYWSMIYPAP